MQGEQLNTLVRLTGNFIIAFGFLAVIVGILAIFGLENFISGFLTQLLGPNPTLGKVALNLIPSVIGYQIILEGLLFMAAGEFLVLFVDLVQSIKKIAEK